MTAISNNIFSYEFAYFRENKHTTSIVNIYFSFS